MATVPRYSDEEVKRLLGEASIDDLYGELSAALPGHEGFGTNAVAKGKAAYKNLLRCDPGAAPHHGT